MRNKGTVLLIAAGGSMLGMACSVLAAEVEARAGVGFKVAPLATSIEVDPQAEEGARVLVEFEFTITNRESEAKWFPTGPQAIVPVPLANWYIYKNGYLFGEGFVGEKSPRAQAEEKLEKLEPGESFSGSLKYRLLPRKRGSIIARPDAEPSARPVFALAEGKVVHLAFMYLSSAPHQDDADERWTGSAFSEFVTLTIEEKEGEASSIVSITPASNSNSDLEFSLGVDAIDVIASPPGKGKGPASSAYPLDYTLSNRSDAAMNVILEYASLEPFLIAAGGRPVDLFRGADHYREIVPEDIVHLDVGQSVTHTIQLRVHRGADKPIGGFGYKNVSGMRHEVGLDPGRYFLVFRYSPPKAVEVGDWGKSPSGKPAPKDWWKGTTFSRIIELNFSNSAEEDRS